MSHSVESHLSVDPATYDQAILAFIPGYEEMLRVGVDVVRQRIAPDGLVVDLGAGTGAFAHRVARAMPDARLHLVDVDPAMLARAKERLAPFGARVTFTCASFDDALGQLAQVDAVIASLSLHHVRTIEAKRDLYRRVRAALRPEGVLVNADATMHAQEPFAGLTKSLWAEHLMRHGDTRSQAMERFDAWAHEDTYFGAEVELGMLREAGFGGADVLWRAPPVTVVVAVP
jgi:ubiquinone/menaquinone biosynthesis C-methylase UbiE